jgi:hypothetical protein
VQIQKYNGEQNELNPYNHTAQDSFAHINTGYLFEQTKATTAIAAEMLVPNRLENRVFMPVALRRRN